MEPCELFFAGLIGLALVVVELEALSKAWLLAAADTVSALHPPHAMFCARGCNIFDLGRMQYATVP